MLKDLYLKRVKKEAGSIEEVDCFIAEVNSSKNNKNAIVIIPTLMSFFSIFIISISSLLNIDYSNRQTLYAASISYINSFEKNAIITNELNESKIFESMAELFDTSSLYNKVGGYLMGFFIIFVIVVFLIMGNQWVKKNKLSAYYEYKRELIKKGNALH